MSDDIRAMTAQLAAEPASLVFLELAEALRRRGQLDAAYRIARTGLQRYPELADAHDLLGRILTDRGELDRAFEAWATAVQLEPHRGSAHKGLGFLYYRAGDPAAALRHLEWAAQADPADAGAVSAIARIRGELDGAPAAARPDPTPVPAATAELAPPALPFAFEPESAVDEATPAVFAGLDGADDGLLLLDLSGLRLGGGLRAPDGGDVADAVAAHLGGVSKEAARAARLLQLGTWQSVVVESPDGHLQLVAPTEQTVLLVVRPTSWPAGRVGLLADRAARAARSWLEGHG